MEKRSYCTEILKAIFWIPPLAAASLAMAAIFSLPSSTEKAWLFGLSPGRLLIAVIPLFCAVVCAVFLVAVLSNPSLYLRLTRPILNRSIDQLEISGIFCLWASLLTGALLFFFHTTVAPSIIVLTPQLGPQLPVLAAYLNRLQPLAWLLTFFMGYWSFCLVVLLKINIFRRAGLVLGIGAGVFALLGTLFQWMVFAFQLRVFEQIPGWYWPIIPKPFVPQNFLPFLILLVIVQLFLLFIRSHSKKIVLVILLASLIFILIQLGTGIMEGRGMASLSDRFFLSYHRLYLEEACNANLSASQAIQNYDLKYPSMFFQTKPPGVLWLAFQIKSVANSSVLAALFNRAAPFFELSEFIPGLQAASCKRTIALVSLVFPLIASLSLWAISWFAKHVLKIPEPGLTAGFSAILFYLAPNIAMLPLFPDQAIYPPLFLLVSGFTFYSMHRRSIPGCFTAGALIYLANFLSFSMLPLFLVPVLYLLFVLWQAGSLRELRPMLAASAIPMLIGLLAALAALYRFLGYNIVTRFQRMMATRIEGDFYTRLDIPYNPDPSFWERARQTWDAALLNNIELAVAVNIPVFIFFAAMGIKSLVNLARRTPGPNTAVNAALFTTYLALNGMRAVLGEAGRLWMFWDPVMALLSVQYLMPFLRTRRWGMPVLTSILLISLFLSWQFQDYRMPQLLP